MKVLLATPNFHQPRGNTVTVKRIAEGLEKSGVETTIISITDDNKMQTLPEVDIIHGFHAYRFYMFLQQLAEKPLSYIVTITGTDLNHNLFDNSTRQDVVTCLKEASAVHVFNQEGKEILEKEVPQIKEKLFLIPQGTNEFSKKAFPVKKEDGTFLFVLPAGIRKIKNVPAAIEMLREFKEKNNHIRLWLIGPVLEKEEGITVKQLVDQNKDWIEYLGQVAHDDMGAIYQQADCILNTSISEGQSSAILEAMSYGLPVLAFNNQGNSSIITHHKTGFLYDNRNQFLDYGEQIMNNNELRQAIGQRAKNYIAKHHSSEQEALKLLDIYKDVLS